jgi:glycosyltransferase involved in cell wall biosynthesis
MDADLFIHPSDSENFGISIAEALYAGLPVVTTKGAPWQELEEHNCGWWIDIGVEPLVKALKSAMGLTDDERLEMGRRGHELVLEKYTWDAIGREMAKAYEGVLKKN